jgi:hypothetical protein
MNFICKIVDYKPEENLVIVRFCRQNAPKSIDKYPSYAVSCDKLDFSEYEFFVHSLIMCGKDIIIKQLEEEKSLESNSNTEKTYSTNIFDNLDKILSMDYKEIIFDNQNMKKLEL